ncbi:MAG: Magnesium and cobalt efflux protein CorC [Chromatiales bacterium USCg_Taylor]|nr:MAG: Magnesium and cobalt efflux protein CorC [Chromatiales bacterium USCg_Taylor]
MMVGIEILVILLLVLLNGVFAMSELAVVSSRKARLKVLADKGHRGAPSALDLVENPGRFLATVQIGITLVGVLAGTFGGATITERLAAYLDSFPDITPFGEPIAIGIVVIGITYLSLIIGELVPKQLALKNPERLASAIARPMMFLAKVAAPIVYFLELSSRLVLRLLGARRTPEQTVTEEEVKAVVAEGVTAGALKREEKEMISGVMRLADWPVQAIMTPRQEVVWLDLDEGDEAIARRLQESHFSRLPVARGSLDRVLGIVQAKDLLNRAIAGKSLGIESALCQPVIVHRYILALQLLEMFRQSPIHMALVLDASGGLEGIVTAADFLKAIVGGLAEAGGKDEPEAFQREDGSWLIDGDLHIDVVKDRLGLREIPDERDFHTVAGLILWRLERVPAAGDHTDFGGFRFEVVDMDGPRIDKVLAVALTGSPVESENPTGR